MTPLRIRKDIRTLTPSEKDDLMHAFHAIQTADPNDPDSFFQIAGYHGEPFRGAGYSNPQWWGGYCNHGNILFPTWHRAYLLRLEAALQKHVPGVMVPYWNEIDEETAKTGIPQIFLDEEYTFSDGRGTIENPLRGYTFQKTIHDRLAPIPDADYSKPKNVKTVRFPFSGLYGENDVDATIKHNEEQSKGGIAESNGKLNLNVLTWLLMSEYQPSNPVGDDKGKKPKPLAAGARERYLKSLDAPNYLVFSNTSSAQKWNGDKDDGSEPVVPIESPHNKMHLAIGGIQIPTQNASMIPGANGDMAENDTASFDPIFFFHHSFIDRMFWTWQHRHGQTDKLIIEEQHKHYPGTNSVDAQGPTPGVPGNTWLSLESPLNPFVGDDGQPLTSNVCCPFSPQLIILTDNPLPGHGQHRSPRLPIRPPPEPPLRQPHPHYAPTPRRERC